MPDSTDTIASVVTGGSVKVDTSYLLFSRVGSTVTAPAGVTPTDHTWQQVGRTDARSAEAATKKYAEDNPPKAGESLTLVAVAAARWSPQTFKSRTVTTVEAVS